MYRRRQMLKTNIPILLIRDSTAYTQSASSHTRLLAEILPRALDAGLSRIAIETGWQKSGLVPFSKSVLEGLPEGFQRSPFQRGNVRNISGKVLTDHEAMIQIWEWRLSQIEKLLTKKNLDKYVASCEIAFLRACCQNPSIL